MLQIQNISKRYGHHLALNRCNLHAKEGQIVGILGHNGSGKTTLFRVCLSLLPASEGQVLYNSKALSPLQCGYMPEERAVYKDITVNQLITYLASLKKIAKHVIQVRLKHWLSVFELTAFQHHLLGSLSKGNQQKVQFICALIHQPKILILDEPLTGLDASNTQLFKQVITAVSQQGTIILLSSHQYEEIEQFCEYVLLLKQGETVLQGNLDTLKKTDGRVCVTLYKTNNLNPIPKGCLWQQHLGRYQQFCFTNREYADQFLRDFRGDFLKIEPISLRELVGGKSC